jgi:hypothetical protein
MRRQYVGGEPRHLVRRRKGSRDPQRQQGAERRDMRGVRVLVRQELGRPRSWGPRGLLGQTVKAAEVEVGSII